MKNLQLINTKLDGIQPFEFWDKEDFQDRTMKFYSGNLGDMKLDKESPIDDNFIICDFCSEDIKEFPVPVFRGSHALCPKCYQRVIR